MDKSQLIDFYKTITRAGSGADLSSAIWVTLIILFLLLIFVTIAFLLSKIVKNSENVIWKLVILFIAVCLLLFLLITCYYLLDAGIFHWNIPAKDKTLLY